VGAGLTLSFDDDFASPVDWARMYRARGIQVVPGHAPRPHFQWKRPALREWKTFQEELVPEAVFDRWYGPRGEYTQVHNMGILTGHASGNIFVIDLDTHKNAAAMDWWRGVLEVHNHGFEPETWQQVTGGGGKQLFFRAPPNWVAPTNRTAIGVDIRGQGGFAVLPPSPHESGQSYRWIPGLSPWETEIEAAEAWLLEEVEKLVGGNQPQSHTQRTASPETDFNAFGARVDGREDYMAKLIWMTLVGMWCKSPIGPPTTGMDETYEIYERKVKSRIFEPSVEKRDLLEREGRGHSLFVQKWQYALGQWHDGIAERAREELAKKPPAPPKQALPPRLALTSAEFVAGFSPPDYLIEGVLQRRFLYSMTAATGTGKTAVALLIVALADRGLKLGEKETTKGRALYFAGENPDDVRMRWLAQTQALGLRPEDMNTLFIPGVFKLSEIEQRVRDEMAEYELVLVVVDTSAAYNEGDDENSNTQMGAHARRMRALISLPGGPCVLVLCHPAKNATDDNLTPRGGSAFLAEVDGNLVLSKDDGIVDLHWQGKFRGPEFSPFSFQLDTVTHQRLIDTKGRLVPTVIARVLSDEARREMSKNNRLAENEILQSLDSDPKLSDRERAKALGWLMRDNVTPYQMKVVRALTALRKGGYVFRNRAGWSLTEKGQNELNRVQNLDVSDGGLKA
jgi:hypothetical protein